MASLERESVSLATPALSIVPLTFSPLTIGHGKRGLVGDSPPDGAGHGR